MIMVLDAVGKRFHNDGETFIQLIISRLNARTSLLDENDFNSARSQ
jgi:hypothetical protein